MPFGMVSVVGPGINVIDGGPRAPKERGCFGIICPIGLNGQNGVFCTELYLTRT